MKRQPDQRPGAVARRIVEEYRRRCGLSSRMWPGDEWLQRRIAVALRKAARAKGGQ
jgi:hypothetical protein